MKYIKILTAALVVLVSSCEVENQYPSRVVDVTYPQITLKGAPEVSIAVGTPYTDAGATLTDDITGAVSDIEATDNPVDVNTPGLYMVTYEATNANGFQTIKQRPVAVTNIDPSWDLSGTYVRTSNGVEVHLTEVANGLYLNDNVGGVSAASAAFIFPVYMAQLSESSITVPPQIIADRSVMDCVNETLNIAPGDTSYSYIVDNPSFGKSVRTFVKQ